MSVVLPCYHAAALAERSVVELRAHLEGGFEAFEIIVVDDGGGDFRPDAFAGAADVTLLRLPVNRGKGAAVRAGMRVARGAVRVYTDVDLPYDLELIDSMAWFVRERGYHVVIGDRTLPGSEYGAVIGLQRHLASSVFSAFVGRLVTGGFFDTQCGLKAVRGDVADEIFALQRLNRFAFDVEVVYLALKHRLDVKRIPVRLRRNDTSSVRLLRDSTQGFVDMLRIKYHQVRGRYRSPALEEMVEREFQSALATVRGDRGEPAAHGDSPAAAGRSRR